MAFDDDLIEQWEQEMVAIEKAYVDRFNEFTKAKQAFDGAVALLVKSQAKLFDAKKKRAEELDSLDIDPEL